MRSKISMLHTYFSAVIVGYVLAIIFAVSQSNMAVIANSRLGILAGPIRGIRGDEYSRWTPMILGQKSRGDFSAQSFFSQPLLVSSDLNLGFLLYPFKFLFSFLPTANYFAALWWLPFVFLLIGTSLTLKAFGASDLRAIAIAFITTLAPAIFWWSGGVINILGGAVFTLGVLLQSLRWKMPTPLYMTIITFVVGNFVGVGLTYPPLAAMYTLLFFPILLFFAYESKNPLIFKSSQKIVLTGCIFALLLTLEFIIDFRIFQVFAGTNYPGQRHSDGGVPYPFSWFFSGTQNWVLFKETSIIASNQSEMSLGYGFLLIPTLYLAVKYISSLKTFVLFFGPVFIFMIWCFIQIPGGNLNPFSRFMPTRALMGITLVIPIYFGLIMELVKVKSDKKRNYPELLVLFLTLFLLVDSSKNYIDTQVSNVPRLTFFLVSIITASVGILLTLQGRLFNLGLLSLIGLSLALSFPINPMARGVDPYFAGPIYEAIRDSGSDSRWASDNIVGEAVLIANERFSLSGQQTFGPAEEKWRLLDPDSLYESTWNNAQSYVLFDWSQDRQQAKIYEPSPQLLTIQISPCSRFISDQQITHIFSSKFLPPEIFDCLELVIPEPISVANGSLYPYRIKQ